MNTSPNRSPSPSWWARLHKTPLADLLRGRVTGSLDVRAAVEAFALADLACRLARRTRLSAAERVAVARELAQRFRDGLASGSTPDQLIASLGDVKPATRAIRRDKLRARPLVWGVWRRSWQAAGLLVLVFVGFLGFLAVRLLTAHPTISHNYARDIIAPAQNVAEADRAWPYYRTALQKYAVEPEVMVLDRPRDDSPGDWGGPGPQEYSVRLDASREMPDGEHWPLVVEWLEANRPAIDAILQGAVKPRLGFVYSDPADQDWLQKSGCTAENWNGPLAYGVYLPHVAAVRDLWRLLRIDARAALAVGDSKRLVADVEAIVRMSEQVHGDISLLLVDQVSLSGLRQALDAVQDALASDPGVLDDDDLRQLSSRLAGFTGSGPFVVRFEAERLALHDFLQRAYSDDGTGGGVMTLDGVEHLRTFRSGTTISWVGARTREAAPLLLRNLRFPAAVVATAVSPFILDRRAVAQAVDEVFAAAALDCRRPLWKWKEPIFSDRLADLRRGWIDTLRYTPLLTVMPEIGVGYAAAQLLTQERDATLVAVALEQFHRRHDAWPERLEQLVPDYLPEVPADRITGRPLRYRLIDGEPLAYSVGVDRDDNGGRATDDRFAMIWAIVGFCRDPSASLPSEVVGRDWILWPPPKDAD